MRQFNEYKPPVVITLKDNFFKSFNKFKGDRTGEIHMSYRQQERKNGDFLKTLHDEEYHACKKKAELLESQLRQPPDIEPCVDMQRQLIDCYNRETDPLQCHKVSLNLHECTKKHHKNIQQGL